MDETKPPDGTERRVENVGPPGGPRFERRIDELGREAFNLAVTSATKAATQQVARVHRVRLVRQTAIVTFLLVAAMMLPVAVALYNSAVHQQRANSLYNCHLIQRLSEPLSQFVLSDAHLRDAQAHLSTTPKLLAKFKGLLGAKLLAEAQAESDKINRETLHFWTGWVAPQLDKIASAEKCSVRIQ